MFFFSLLLLFLILLLLYWHNGIQDDTVASRSDSLNSRTSLPANDVTNADNTNTTVNTAAATTTIPTSATATVNNNFDTTASTANAAATCTDGNVAAATAEETGVIAENDLVTAFRGRPVAVGSVENEVKSFKNLVRERVRGNAGKRVSSDSGRNV